MPQPSDVEAAADELIRLYRQAQTAIEAEALDATTSTRRRARLAELRRTIDAELDVLQGATRAWLQTSLTEIYARGAGQATATGADQFTWTQTHREAVLALAQDAWDDVLASHGGVRRQVRRFVLTEGRRQQTLSLIEGRTARQAARQLVTNAAEARDIIGGVGLIPYADGSYRRLSDYADMLLRTKTAQAYNAGTLNQLGASDIAFVEVFDGADCGWTTHEDGDKANGTVRTIRDAAAHPLSHPRCRRSFGGRPDITTSGQAAQARPSTTAAQRDDSATFERARERGFTDRRRRRQSRERRRLRGQQARTPRTGRQPRSRGTTAASRIATTPADPVAGPAVGRAVTVIDRTHRTPAPTRPVNVTVETASRANGSYTPTTRTITIRPDGPSPAFTAVHEWGHHLDFDGIGSRPGLAATLTDDTLMADWRLAIENTDAHRQLLGARSRLARLARTGDQDAARYVDHLDYLLMPEELWARSYSQWVAVRSGNAELLEGLAQRRAGSIPYQWLDDDFEPIAGAIDRLFTTLGLWP